jgi:hypothetical protein
MILNKAREHFQEILSEISRIVTEEFKSFSENIECQILEEDDWAISYSKKTNFFICFRGKLLNMPDIFIKYIVLHEFMHCVLQEADDKIIDEKVFSLMQKYFNTDKNDFMAKFGHLLGEY